MAQAFWQLYYHVVWSTKDRAPQLTEPLRPPFFEAIQDKCRRLDCRLHAVNATEDHVHLAIEVPPSRAVASVVGQIKGAAAHQVNQSCPGAIHWQDGYGIVSFRASELETVKRYIATQQQRHQPGALSP